MAVSFTSNIGLAKPTENELADNWINSNELQEDNNLIIIDKMDVNLVSYTPTIIAQTTAPNIGAGSVAGEYQDIQGIIQGNLIIQFTDPGVTAGSGEYGFSLPFPADNVYHTVGTALNANSGTNSVIGEGYILDASAQATSGPVALEVVTIAGVSYVRFITETYAGKANQMVGSAGPFTLATGDKFAANFCYKKL